MSYPAQTSRSLEDLKTLGLKIKETGEQNAKTAEKIRANPLPPPQILPPPTPLSQPYSQEDEEGDKCRTESKITDDVNDILDEFRKNQDGVLCLIREALDDKEETGHDTNDNNIFKLLFQLLNNNKGLIDDADTFNQIQLLNTRFTSLQLHGGKKSKKQRSKSHKKSRKQRRKSS